MTPRWIHLAALFNGVIAGTVCLQKPPSRLPRSRRAERAAKRKERTVNEGKGRLFAQYNHHRFKFALGRRISDDESYESDLADPRQTVSRWCFLSST